MSAIATSLHNLPYSLNLLIAIGNTRVKTLVVKVTSDRKRQILSTYAHTHDQLDRLQADLQSCLQENFGEDLPQEPQNLQKRFTQIAIASVVPHLRTPWHDLPQTKILTIADVPLGGLYPTMGCDRALAAFGAGETYGYPVLVIDAGTAITITGIDGRRNLIGGAIIAGLRSQFASLYQNTAALPSLPIPESAPTLWARHTAGAIQSGIVQMILAGLGVYIDDWRSRYGDRPIIITGGDGAVLQQWGLGVDVVNPNLIFEGMLYLLT